MNSKSKLWHFRINNPVDIIIACDYVNKKFPDRVGKEPAADWSWLDMTAYFRFEPNGYSNRPKNYSIVFDPVMNCWLIQSNWSSNWHYRFVKLFGRDVDYREISNLAMNRDLRNQFDDFYEEKMEESKLECDLPDSVLSLAKRVADIELKQHDAELQAMWKRHRELQREEQFRRDNMFSPMLSCPDD